ncbi:mitochondrial brown fat uncoupling protein 1 isoform X2 [Phycodurus eques]|uniref:mitochondrial brown fat uncoupling protein 1 isoform X2 n=1 Tax=Phycodurus eques TaxID=693459 RepID=UPI002ACDCE5E|nr:mitochondrial brown fat uncoupling protein 1 isoform X2 [Phycodurus eques]
MVGLKPSDVPPPLGVKMASAGAAACIADIVTFPLDTAKVRLQIQGEKKVAAAEAKAIRYRGVFGTISTMIRTEGPRSLYNGLVAGLQRQVCFASVRIGLYDNVKDFYTGGAEHAGVLMRILAGCTTGAMAVSFAQPTDVVKVRFQAQMNLDGVARRYSGTMQAYRHIFRNEGLRGLWKDNLPCHFVSAFGAGFVTTVIASPVDVVKTRYMNSPPGQYRSAINCAWTMLTKEGPTAFYKGFVPSFLRLGSWNVVMFVSFEQIKRAMMVTKKRFDASN